MSQLVEVKVLLKIRLLYQCKWISPEKLFFQGLAKGENNEQWNKTMEQNNGTKQWNIIKQNTLLIVKRGSFYNVYKDDALIFRFLFGYKITDEFRCGFPEAAFAKVINVLENKKINYQIIFKDKDTIIKRYGKLNKYEKVLKNALEYNLIADRVDRIKEKLCNIDDINCLEKIIKVIENEL